MFPAFLSHPGYLVLLDHHPTLLVPEVLLVLEPHVPPWLLWIPEGRYLLLGQWIQPGQEGQEALEGPVRVDDETEGEILCPLPPSNLKLQQVPLVQELQQSHSLLEDPEDLGIPSGLETPAHLSAPEALLRQAALWTPEAPRLPFVLGILEPHYPPHPQE